MTTHVSVTANGDYVLTRPVEPNGRLSIAWTPLGAATVTLKARHIDSADASTVDVPIANGKLTAALLDGQSTTLQSLNIECRCDTVVATVTAYSAGFEIWCS